MFHDLLIRPCRLPRLALDRTIANFPANLVVEYFEKEGRVVKVVATKTPDEVYKETREKLEQRLGKNF